MTPTPGFIAVGINGSAGSDTAVRYAAARARRSGVGLRLVHALPDYLPASRPFGISVGDLAPAGRALLREASRIAREEWAEAWGPSGVAYHVASRPLLQGHDRPWLDEWRRRLEDVRVRGLECVAAARLGLGGPTLPQAEDCARRLVELAPYRETGQRILLEALEQRGNVAEALRAYERLRVMLRDELGIAPSPAVQQVYRRLLDASTTRTSA